MFLKVPLCLTVSPILVLLSPYNLHTHTHIDAKRSSCAGECISHHHSGYPIVAL